MGRDVIPVFTNHFKDSSANTVTFDSGLGYFFADHDSYPTVDAVLVLGVFDENMTVATRQTVSIQITEAAMTMKSVFLS